MIENKNLNNHFLEVCKKDNLDRLKMIIKQAKENGIALDTSEGFIKASRYGKIKNLELLINHPDITNDILQKSILYTVHNNHLYTFKYLHNEAKSCLDNNDIFTSVYMSGRKDFLIYLLVDKYQIPESLEKDILQNTHPQLAEIKDFYLKIKSLINLNNSLEKDLSVKTTSIKNKI